jgi:hypothetical protein
MTLPYGAVDDAKTTRSEFSVTGLEKMRRAAAFSPREIVDGRAIFQSGRRRVARLSNI